MLNNKDTKTFMLFPTCVPVKGAKNSAIYDLARHRIHTFPTPYFDLIEAINRSNINETIQKHGFGSQKEKVNVFVEWLLNDELAFFTDTPEQFPELDNDFVRPSQIENCVIDVEDELHDFSAICGELNDLGCEYVQVRSYGYALTPSVLRQISFAASDTSIRSVELVLRDLSHIGHLEWLDALHSCKNIARLCVHSSRLSRRIPVAEDDSDSRVLEFIQDSITSADACGRIQLSTLCAPSVNIYLETQRFNGCLNRKISISGDGSIRNCPSICESFGLFGNVKLADIAADARFQRRWHHRKDDISVCRDCEFRYSCTDCRAFIDDPNDEYSKPSKCNYDPYLGKWLTDKSPNSTCTGFGVQEAPRQLLENT